jgi:hypothetical protein
LPGVKEGAAAEVVGGDETLEAQSMDRSQELSNLRVIDGNCELHLSQTLIFKETIIQSRKSFLQATKFKVYARMFAEIVRQSGQQQLLLGIDVVEQVLFMRKGK